MTAYSEMFQAPGVARAHWGPLATSMDSLGLDEWHSRGRNASRLLRQNGVTYNVYADRAAGDAPAAKHPEHPWRLDPIPMLIDAAEWASLENALQQRARLLELILADLYGPGRLTRCGLLPAALVQSHPGFLRSCVRPPAHSGRPSALVSLAVDIARSPTGGFVAMSDRAQAPSGVGYALENRIVLARSFADIYQNAGVSRLAVYFRALHETLRAIAPPRDGEPRIVLLTPGPGSETYFEHAFLASYLGYTLVEGSDLIVNQQRVWLRTISSDEPEPVDVILRRLDDLYLDPLELRPDSLLGAAGLLQAMRAGNVALANPPGSGVLENPALLAYLPGICKDLLGETLEMPSVPAFWCGDDQARQHVLSELPHMVIKSTFPRHGGRSYFPDRMSAPEREALAEQIQRRPHYFVGQERMALSTLPCLIPGRNAETGQPALEERPMVLRSFVLARHTEESFRATQLSNPATDFVVMPGGLTRVSGDANNPSVSNQEGGIAKDTWIVTGEATPRDQALLRTPDGAVLISRRSGDIASRVADNLFWLGRYLERSDAMVRLLREALRHLLEGEAPDPNTREYLLMALSHLCTSYPGFLDPTNRTAPIPEILDLVHSPERTGSLAFNLQACLRAGARVRDRLSEDGWRLLNALPDQVEPPEFQDAASTLQNLERLALDLAAFAGIVTETLNHGHGWRFLESGRRVERAIGGLSLLRSLVSTAVTDNGSLLSSSIRHDQLLLETLLYMKDSLRLYRRRYAGAAIESDAALDILLLDEGHPQSVGYQIARLAELSADYPAVGRGRSRAERLMIEAQSTLRLTELERLDSDEDLHGTLERLSGLLFQFSDSLEGDYLRSTQLPTAVQTA